MLYINIQQPSTNLAQESQSVKSSTYPSTNLSTDFLRLVSLGKFMARIAIHLLKLILTSILKQSNSYQILYSSYLNIQSRVDRLLNFYPPELSYLSQPFSHFHPIPYSLLHDLQDHQERRRLQEVPDQDQDQDQHSRSGAGSGKTI